MAARVIWVVKGLGPGGAERLLAELARAGLAADAADETAAGAPGADVSCVYVRPDKDHLVADLERAGVRCACVGGRSPDLGWPWRLARLVRASRADVVHVHAPLPGAVVRLAVLTMRRADRPAIVTTEHNAWPTYHPVTRWANRLTGRGDAATLAVSAEVAGSLRGSAASRVEVLRHGIDVAAVRAFAPERGAVRADLGVGPDEVLAMTVANFREQKDYPNLLRAMQLLLDRAPGRPAVRLVAVGQGPGEHAARALHAALGLGDHVVLTGFRADAARLLAGADLFVLASRWEGLPVAAMEAVALGLPVVSTRVGGIAEAFTDGHDALLVAPGDPAALADAIALVAADPVLRARLAAGAAALADSFDVGRAARHHAALYARLAPAPRARRASRAQPARRAPSTSPVAAGRPPARRTEPQIPVQVRPAEQADRPAVLSLVAAAMHMENDDRLAALYAWKHDANPFGPSPTWVAVADGQVVAVRAMMRWRFRRGTEVLTAVRAVDTATHPSVQGRGLFRRLTLHALDELRGSTDFVFNTPNGQSRPGYLSMGWQIVGQVPAAASPVGAGGPAAMSRARVPAELWSEPVVGHPEARPVDGALAAVLHHGATGQGHVRELSTDTSIDYWSWRLSPADLHYRVVVDGDTGIAFRVRRRGAARELAVVAAFGDPARSDRLARRVAGELRCDYVLRAGRPALARRFLPVPVGPLLTWRALRLPAMPPMPNWALSLSDVELF